MASESSPDPPPSAEESDSLERSIKRIKDDRPSTLSSEPPIPGVVPPNQKSFKDMLIDGGADPIPSMITVEELMAAGDKVQAQAPMMANDVAGVPKKSIPKAYIPKAIWQKLCAPWKNSLIVNLLGKRVNYHLLCNRLVREWRTEDEFEVIDIGKGFYVVKFSSPEDCSRVLIGGPYKFFDHYLAVQPWEPNFQPSRAKLPKTAIWVKLYEVPMEYYHEAAILYLGNKLGRAIKVDRTTLLATRGEFARVCVEVDLNESLPSMIALDLEELPQSLILVEHPLPPPAPTGGTAIIHENLSMQHLAEHSHIPDLSDNCMTYGSWMVAKRKPRKVVKQRSSSDPTSSPGGTHLVDSDRRGNHAKSISQLTPNSVRNNNSNRFAAIAVEDDSSGRIPSIVEVNSASISVDKETAPEHFDMEVAPYLSTQSQRLGSAPESSKVQSKWARKKEKSKDVLGPVSKPPKSTGSKFLDSNRIRESIKNNSSRLVNVTVAASPLVIKGSSPQATPRLTPVNPNSDLPNTEVIPLPTFTGEATEHGPGNIIGNGGTDDNVLVTDTTPAVTSNDGVPQTKAAFGSTKLNFMRRRGYDMHFQVPAAGFAGGLWLFWNSSAKLSILFSTSQAIHCALQEWSREHSGAWVLMGDLNDILSMDEISPRTTSVFHRTQRFRCWLESCGLMNMESLGCKFTWCRLRNGRVVLRERLDRVLFNSGAQILLQGAKVFTLPRIHSDHHPILLDLDTAASQIPVNKPLRFEAAWLSRDEFRSVFHEAWSQHASQLPVAIHHTKEACNSWGKSVFGNIFKKKRLLRARITGIQNSPRYYSSSQLQALEQELLDEYQQILYEEELLWFQKSRVDWIASGDRNTSFYHLSTMVRRSKNKIGALKIGGEWNMDPDALKSHVRNFSMELFISKDTAPSSEDLFAFQHTIPIEQHSLLIQPATLEEVRAALFSMKGLKSPGPDGIQALFYQQHWDTVSRTFLDFVNQALLEGCFDPVLTRAYVALIPKEDSPDVIQKFRPISLLNVAYKVLSKLIVNRLCPHLQKIVGPHQSSFLAGRSTVDNIILTQEAVHSMKRLKGRRGAMVLKIDLHKAFDSIDWGFLRQVLTDFNVPQQLINLIMFAVTSVQLEILWNGEPLPSFRPMRGLRQGDPLSPYLFILVMEKLAHMIQGRVFTKDWKPYKLSRGGDNALWCKAMRDKYLRGSKLLEARGTRGSSFLWRGVLQCCSVLQLGIKWRIGSGESVNFWTDTWASHKPLLNASNAGVSLSLLSMTVADAITLGKEWNLNTLYSLVSEEAVEIIRAIPLSKNLQTPDSIFWDGTTDGSFTVKSAYHLIQAMKAGERREPDNLAAALLSDIRDLMAQFESCMLQHVLREGNAAADFLASLGHTSPPGLSILDSPPTGLRPILLGDQMGASFLRL
ncbi:hypothetical protein SLEP1_g27155 [Rubroshorea leprosula]|uniref:Reverse transcriptase domain-containing protein n=1 Tax=Rubroshorea leprosula TaxID=152421 RepID=A0AAV5JPC0_9ROSI|nr:hypothetical protein SLEP1_g27155 [Rubroshorea leprosula]